jgi:thiol:disulfide interchange protein DsbD
MFTRLLPTLLLLLLSPWCAAAPVQQPHSAAELIAERTAVTPGQPLSVALRLALDNGWHVYWKNPGDSGMATSIAWALPAGFQPGPMQWPAPRRIDVGPLTSYGYEGEAVHLVDIAVPADLQPGARVPLRAKADWLVCKEICLPASANLEVELPVSAQSGPADPRWAKTFAAARAGLPAAAPAESVAAYRAGTQLVVRISPAVTPALRSLAFFPEREGLIQYAAAQQFVAHAQGFDLQLTAATASTSGTLAGVLVADPGFDGRRALSIDVPVHAGPPPVAPRIAASGATFAAALALAFAGGLLLNLMPCVFPVLAIKVLSVAQQAHGRAAAMRTHGLLFAAGVVASFWLVAGLLLALRTQGAALGWGYQLQSPAVVAGLALLFFLLALNLSGVFQMGSGLQALAGRVRARHAHVDALLSGALATAVASPCTAPFMGAALGFALLQPALEAMLVFTALAVGMALPYVVLTFVPQLTRRLPRPGAWMETLRQVLAFPLYATVVWLLWVLGQQTGLDALARMLFALLLVAAALWSLGRSAHARGAARMVTRLLAIALLAGALGLAWSGTQPQPQPAAASAGAWQPWSEAAVQAALAQGHPAFVDFTAAWCVTCQVNKRLVLQADEVERRFQRAGVVRLRADWTNRDPAITDALARLQRSGVPVYAMYVPPHQEPQLLPEILTRRLVLEALDRAERVAALSSAPRSSARQEQP